MLVVFYYYYKNATGQIQPSHQHAAEKNFWQWVNTWKFLYKTTR